MVLASWELVENEPVTLCPVFLNADPRLERFQKDVALAESKVFDLRLTRLQLSWIALQSCINCADISWTRNGDRCAICIHVQVTCRWLSLARRLLILSNREVNSELPLHGVADILVHDA